MKIYLAPMEGLADVYLRELIANTGSYDLVVSEFVRIVDVLLPKKVFIKQVPELASGATTSNSTPIRVQLLGSNPSALADNAATAIELGSHGVDLNFGCPSKTVNASKGGAVLLKEPETIYSVVNAVRNRIGSEQTLSAKMRLGYEDLSTMWESAHAIADAGATEIVVHARTKSQGYKPPAYWHLVAEFEEKLGIPVIINGEIWSPENAQQALMQARCKSIMIGRGAVRDPFLAKHIKAHSTHLSRWIDIAPLVDQFWNEITSSMSPKYCSGRLKQWLKFLKEVHPEAELLFQAIRKETDVRGITTQVNSFTTIK